MEAKKPPDTPSLFSDVEIGRANKTPFPSSPLPVKLAGLMQCTRCGHVNPPGPSTVCAQCGSPFTMGADPVVRAILPVGRTALSIIAGYLGLGALFCLPAPLALAVGIWALLDLKRRPGMHGKGRAIFGIVAGAVGTACMLAWLVTLLVAGHR